MCFCGSLGRAFAAEGVEDPGQEVSGQDGSGQPEVHGGLKFPAQIGDGGLAEGGEQGGGRPKGKGAAHTGSGASRRR